MEFMPTCPIMSCSIGDVLKGQDGKKYIVCKKANITYWEPYEETSSASSSNTPQPTSSNTTTRQVKPVKKTKPVKGKFYWKDNDRKPEYDGPNWYERYEMEKSLKPKVSPNKFPAGYVWTTKFSNISFIVDTTYEGYSKTSTRVWKWVGLCPPCLDAEDYPYKYKYERYAVDYDEKGNKFWTYCCGSGSDDDEPLLLPSKFPYGHIYTTGNGSQFKRSVCSYDGDAYWKEIEESDSDDE